VTRLFEVRPYIIAEIGSNWLTLSDCLESIAKAKMVGADAVKFQAFSHEALYGWDDRKLDALGSVERHQLQLTWLPKLREKADACGIELGVTAFSPELVAAVDPYVGWHKVASSDCAWPQLLEAVRRTGKPVVISFGAHGRVDVEEALRRLEGTPRVAMYCVAAYPAYHVDLAAGELFYEILPPYRPDEPVGVGFSDHSLGTGLALEAASQGCTVIEKHVTFIDADTPDRPHSLDADGFKLMVDTIRGKRVPTLGPTPEERAMVLRHNRRLIATRDVAQGETLRYGENFGAYRSLEDDYRGLSPWAWEQVEGKRATKAIARGKGVGPGDFE